MAKKGRVLALKSEELLDDEAYVAEPSKPVRKKRAAGPARREVPRKPMEIFTEEEPVMTRAQRRNARAMGPKALQKAAPAETKGKKKNYVDKQDLFGYEDDYRRSHGGGNGLGGGRGKASKTKKKAPLARRIMVGGVACLLLAGGGFFAFHVYQQQRYIEMAAAVEINTFYPGITIDGVDVSGMTLDQAKERWSKEIEEKRAAFRLGVTADDQEFVVDDKNAFLEFDALEVVEEAYNLNRNGELQARYDNLARIAESRAYTTNMTYNLEPVRDAIVRFCETFRVEPVDAAIKSFDFEAATFSLDPERDGRIPQSHMTANAAIALMEKGQYSQKVPLTFTPRPAELTQAALADQIGLVASFTTKTSGSSSRNTNIRLASEAINGTVLQPGEVFSFNEATGERTRAKGYRTAGAIIDGVMSEDTGGGVCQASTTLFNAVVRADLAVVERSAHTFASAYIDFGEDAAVNYPNQDFKFRNNTDSPIYIRMWYADRRVTAEIYGMKLKNGVTIELESNRSGMSASTYRVYYDAEGNEIERVRQHRSSYRKQKS